MIDRLLMPEPLCYSCQGKNPSARQFANGVYLLCDNCISHVNPMPKVEPKLSKVYVVLAYAEGGYGDDRTRSFRVKEDAIQFARSLDAKFRPKITEIITMEPIRTKIEWSNVT